MIGRLVKLVFIVVGWYLVWPALATSAQNECALTFGFTGDAQVSGVLVDIDYSASPGGFIGSADDVECFSHVGELADGSFDDPALKTFNNIEGEKLLKAALVRVAPFGGRELFTCFFAGLESVDTDLVVATADATTFDLEAVVPLPAIGVTAVDCSGAAAAGLAPSGATTNSGSNGLDCGPGRYDVVFAVASANTVGSLQLSIEYAGASGEFVGSGENVDCHLIGKATSGFTAFNDIEARSTIYGGFVSVAGVGSGEFVSCSFDADYAVPSGDDFYVSVLDATTPRVEPISPLPVMTVASIMPAATNNGCAPVCGNGRVESGEACDDGNLSNDDACLNNCTLAVCGDANGNGTVTATDAKAVLNRAVGVSTLCAQSRCDVDGDSLVTASDAGLVLASSVGLGTALQCPLDAPTTFPPGLSVR